MNGNGHAYALGYIRVSTDEQAREGVSLDVQREKIAQYAALHDLDLVAILPDAGYSAKDLNRPAMRLLLEATRGRKIGAIITYKLDRLFRNLRDAVVRESDWRGRGVTLHSVSETLDTSTAIGRAVFGILSTLAQWEREVNGERVRASMRHAQANGQRMSAAAANGIARTPYGSCVDSENPAALARNEKEQEILNRMRLLRDSGESYAGIAKALTREGYPPRGSGWYARSIQRILEREAERPTALV